MIHGYLVYTWGCNPVLLDFCCSNSSSFSHWESLNWHLCSVDIPLSLSGFFVCVFIPSDAVRYSALILYISCHSPRTLGAQFLFLDDGIRSQDLDCTCGCVVGCGHSQTLSADTEMRCVCANLCITCVCDCAYVCVCVCAFLCIYIVSYMSVHATVSASDSLPHGPFCLPLLV